MIAMTPRQHLRLLRFLRLLFFGLGVVVILPHVDVQREPVGVMTAANLLAGIGLMFVPYLIVTKFIAARCPQCGSRVYTKTEWEAPTHDNPEQTENRIKAFRWNCQSCGHRTSIPSNAIDNWIPPFIQG